MKPSLYEPRFCKMLIEHMKEGLSFNSFASVIGKSRQTLLNWAEKYPEFQEAREIAEGHSLLFWEKAGIGGLRHSKENQFNTVLWIVNMCNRFDWRQRPKDEEKDEKEKPQAVVSMTDDQLVSLIKKARAPK